MGKGDFVRTNGTQSPIWFPGDPETYPFLDQSYSWVVGHVWTIRNTMVNQASYGETFENFNFPNSYNPTGPTQYNNGFGGNGSGGAVIMAPTVMPLMRRGELIPSRSFVTISVGRKGSTTSSLAGRSSGPSRAAIRS